MKDKKIIKRIIENEEIAILFQPIVSIKKKSVLGLEALCRGLCNGEVIMPDLLFSMAAAGGLTVELDRLCRKKALEIFSLIQSYREDLLLFLNFDASIIDQGVVGSGVLLGLVQKLCISPNRIVLEINETRVNDEESLKRFINTHKEYGFIIALDDIGAGHSNLNRVSITRPDILKIDRSLVKDLDKEYYKQEVFKSLINLSRNIGALVVAEGIEKVDEAITALDFGVDMLQGYYFSVPREISDFSWIYQADKIQFIANKLKDYTIKKIALKNNQEAEYESMVSNIAGELKKINRKGFNAKLSHLAARYKYLECVYVLDEAGLQVSSTVCSQKMTSALTRPAFSPAPQGTDHSLKDYYYLLKGTGMVKYVTEPYISLATGNLCTTISAFFENDYGEKFILCVDAKAGLISKAR